MNNVRQLRLRNGIQQKELAIEIGVSNATVSDWEHGRKNPSGERLRRLAEYFGVEPQVVLGQEDLFVPEDPSACGRSETEQIVKRLLDQLSGQPRTEEAAILSKGIDRLPKAQREKALAVVRAMFSEYADYFEKENPDAP